MHDLPFLVITYFTVSNIVGLDPGCHGMYERLNKHPYAKPLSKLASG